MRTPSVQFVFCMDTEGPCNDPARSDLLPTWSLVDRAMDQLFDPAFRRRHLDPAGGQFKVGWFFLTWTGFETNPRSRDLGYHKVRDHYVQRWGDRLHEYGDEHCWHYHHPAPSRIGIEWGLDWSVCREYDAIMSRQILERDWFPSCYRAGGTIMDAVSSRWVDTWFPFDYTNRAPVEAKSLVDWSTGVREWGLYHPSPEDFRQPGTGRRRMARSLDLATWIYSLTDEEIAAGFERASNGRPASVSCFDHDYRDIAPRVDELRERIERIAAGFRGVPWRYAAPVEAARAYLDAPPVQALTLDIAVDADGAIAMRASAPIFQPFPWIAARLRDGTVAHVEDNVERIDQRHWRWRPEFALDWSEVAIGASTELGASATARLRRDAAPHVVLRSDPEQPRSIWQHSRLFPELCEGRASGELPETDSVRQARELLAPHLRQGMRLLDAGCAAGHAARSFAPDGIEYFGIDSSPRAIEIGRRWLPVPADRLRVLGIEALPIDERYDIVLCLNTLSYCPMFHAPLEALARAADRWLVIRSSFAAHTTVRYLPDVLLEPGFQHLRAYFNIYSRADVTAFLEAEGFAVTWVADQRQRERFGGEPEVVGGIALPAEFVFAERRRPRPAESEILGDQFGQAARDWRERREGGPTKP
jgi:hypothetical protein